MHTSSIRFASSFVLAVASIACATTAGCVNDEEPAASSEDGLRGCGGRTPSAPPTSAPTTPAPAPTPAPTTPAPTPAPSTGAWPDATNTGAKGTLGTMAAGSITTAGTVIQNVRITGRLTIEADNVVLRNVYLKSSDYYGILVHGKNLLIEDTTVEGTQTAGIAVGDGGEFVARRVNVFGGPDGIRMGNNSKLYDSYVHDLLDEPGAHNDSVGADGAVGWEIIHNTLLNQVGQTGVVWVGDDRYAPGSGVLQNNLIAGGGYSIYGGPGAPPGIKVIDNKFSTRFFPKGGYWGPVTGWSNTNTTWANNVWLDGANAGKPVTP